MPRRPVKNIREIPEVVECSEPAARGGAPVGLTRCADSSAFALGFGATAPKHSEGGEVGDRAVLEPCATRWGGGGWGRSPMVNARAAQIKLTSRSPKMLSCIPSGGSMRRVLKGAPATAPRVLAA